MDRGRQSGEILWNSLVLMRIDSFNSHIYWGIFMTTDFARMGESRACAKFYINYHRTGGEIRES